jgi:diaminohydroxyphosphoribosylaminopyrimidine deaminase/5-amino-6-(5-phosphoribosylamino)uracil reductase
MTNVMVEGGPRVLGSFHLAGLLREYHIFIAPILIGGAIGMSPLATAAGESNAGISDCTLESVSVEVIEDNVYWQLRTAS